MDYIRYLRSMVGQQRVIMTVSGVFVLDEQDRILLQLRSDTNSWGIPGALWKWTKLWKMQRGGKREKKQDWISGIWNCSVFTQEPPYIRHSQMETRLPSYKFFLPAEILKGIE